MSRTTNYVTVMGTAELVGDDHQKVGEGIATTLDCILIFPTIF